MPFLCPADCLLHSSRCSVNVGEGLLDKSVCKIVNVPWSQKMQWGLFIPFTGLSGKTSCFRLRFLTCEVSQMPGVTVQPRMQGASWFYLTSHAEPQEHKTPPAHICSHLCVSSTQHCAWRILLCVLLRSSELYHKDSWRSLLSTAHDPCKKAALPGAGRWYSNN